MVLALAGAALMLIFSVGVRFTEIAFRLGRHALDLADRQISTDALRVVVRSLTIPPAGSETRHDAVEGAGAPRGFSGPAVLATARPAPDRGRRSGLPCSWSIAPGVTSPPARPTAVQQWSWPT